jgi:chromosome segregation ATPase
MKPAGELAKLQEDVASLRRALDQAKAEEREASSEAEIAQNRLAIVNKTADELRARIDALETERDEVRTRGDYSVSSI